MEILVPIISQFFLGYLQKCLSKQSAEDPRDYLRAHYDAATGTMDEGLIQDTMPAAYRAARKARKQIPRRERKDLPQITREEVRKIAEDSLINAMNGTDDELAAVKVFAASLGDDE